MDGMEKESWKEKKGKLSFVKKLIGTSSFLFVSLIACNKISRGSTIEFNDFVIRSPS